MSDTKYYSLYRLCDAQWTNGFRRYGSMGSEQQDPTQPWPLTRAEVEAWVIADWFPLSDLTYNGYEIKELPPEFSTPEYVEAYQLKMKDELVALQKWKVEQEERRAKEEDQRKRLAHAMKYL